jgi:hypothetical protein
VKNFLLVRLHLRDVACHLLLNSRELGCELVNTLAYRCETERKLGDDSRCELACERSSHR